MFTGCRRKWRSKRRLPLKLAVSTLCGIVALAPLQFLCFNQLAGLPVGSSRLAPAKRGASTARASFDDSTGKAAGSALLGRPTLDLIKAATDAGSNFRDLGWRLQDLKFETTALDGGAKILVDGMQQLRKVELSAGVLDAAGGHDCLSDALLLAMQEAHDKSFEGTKGDVWSLYQDHPELMQAPLSQIGAGNTSENHWEAVVRSDETVRMAEELFDKFDVDADGHWNLQEASAVQLATEGSQMPEDSFNALLISAAPNRGRDLTEEDLEKGLSRDQVIDLYTNADRQRQLGFVLNIRKDYDAVMAKEEGQEAATAGAGAASTSKAPMVVD